MALLPPRRCPHCLAKTIPTWGSASIHKDRPVQCSNCGSWVYGKAQFIRFAFTYASVALIPLAAICTWGVTESGYAAGAAALLMLLLGQAMDFFWPLDVVRPDNAP